MAASHWAARKAVVLCGSTSQMSSDVSGRRQPSHTMDAPQKNKMRLRKEACSRGVGF